MKRSLVGAVTAAAVACASVGALLLNDLDNTTLALPSPEPTPLSSAGPAVVARTLPRTDPSFDLQPSGSLFDPFSAPTPDVAQSGTPAVVPLPTAPSTIHTGSVGKVGTARAGALLSLPLDGRKTSRFGLRFHPVLHVWKLHTGLDFAAPCGTAVGAAAPGKVVRTGWAGGNGIQVKVDHGQLGGHRVVTTYNHLSSIGVKVGQHVDALDGVGRVGSTGYSTGCHLHLEVIVDGQFTDPEPWLNGTPTVVDLSKMVAEVPGGSASPSLSPSPSPSVSPSPSPSPSGSPSPSPSASPSTPGPSKTPSVSPSPSPSPGESSTAPGTKEPSTPAPSTPEPSTPEPTSPEPSEPGPTKTQDPTPTEEPKETASPKEPETTKPAEDEPEPTPSKTAASDPTQSAPEEMPTEEP
ncbi:MAG: peptidoglycan DD-metalloendopeptidase family protein [Arachnia sp.]